MCVRCEQQVDATAAGCGAVSSLQAVQRHMQGDQRRGAGCVHSHGWALQPKGVGNTPSCYIAAPHIIVHLTFAYT